MAPHLVACKRVAIRKRLEMEIDYGWGSVNAVAYDKTLAGTCSSVKHHLSFFRGEIGPTFDERRSAAATVSMVVCLHYPRRERDDAE